jgi:hypothetical protein
MKVPINVWTEAGYVRLQVPAKTSTGQTTFLLAAAEARELAAAIHVAAGGTPEQRSVTCVYCGHAYPQDTPTHGAGISVLTEHIKVCPEHPMRTTEKLRDDAIARVVEAQRLFRRIRSALTFDETTDARDCDLVNQITEFMGDGDGEVGPGR